MVVMVGGVGVGVTQCFNLGVVLKPMHNIGKTKMFTDLHITYMV